MLLIPEGFMDSHNVWVVNLAHQLDLVERVRATRYLLLDYDPCILLLLWFFASLMRILPILLDLDDLDGTVSPRFPLHAVPNLSKCAYKRICQVGSLPILRSLMVTYQRRAFSTSCSS